MNEPKKKPGNLDDLSRDKVKKESEPPKPMTQEEAAQMMAEFYATVANGILNVVAILASMQETMGEMSIDMNDIAFYAKKAAIKSDSVSPLEVEEREKEEDDEPPANSGPSNV